MYTNIEERACDLAEYIIENKATVRAAAKQFNISKSTVHKDLTERLKTVSPALYHQVRELLDINKARPSGISAAAWPHAENIRARMRRKSPGHI